MVDFPIITLDANNISTEHICCGMSGNKNREGVNLKKEWLKKRFSEGLRFKKINVSGKIFIEYIPAEYAWRPIKAPGHMFIQCLWVSGRFKGHGLGEKLLNGCIEDSKKENKRGIVVVSSNKVMPYLTDKGFFMKYGFEICDTAPPYFELLVKKFKRDDSSPQFNESAKKGGCDNKRGLTFIYTDQCPFTALYVNEMADVAKSRRIPAKKIKLETTKDAQSSPSAFGTFGVFYNGDFLTHKIISKGQFEKLLKTCK